MGRALSWARRQEVRVRDAAGSWGTERRVPNVNLSLSDQRAARTVLVRIGIRQQRVAQVRGGWPHRALIQLVDLHFVYGLSCALATDGHWPAVTTEFEGPVSFGFPPRSRKLRLGQLFCQALASST
jgi:hypothetical protein